jgi:hypothetical protein
MLLDVRRNCKSNPEVRRGCKCLHVTLGDGEGVCNRRHCRALRAIALVRAVDSRKLAGGYKPIEEPRDLLLFQKDMASETACACNGREIRLSAAAWQGLGTA